MEPKRKVQRNKSMLRGRYHVIAPELESFHKDLNVMYGLAAKCNWEAVVLFSAHALQWFLSIPFLLFPRKVTLVPLLLLLLIFWTISFVLLQLHPCLF